MTITKQCPNCNTIMTLVPAGTSRKTGKYYNAFWSCSNCKTTANLDNPQDKPAVFAAQLDNSVKDDERTKSIAWMNAKNNACLLIANGKYSQKNLAQDIQDLAILIYNININ